MRKYELNGSKNDKLDRLLVLVGHIEINAQWIRVVKKY